MAMLNETIELQYPYLVKRQGDAWIRLKYGVPMSHGLKPVLLSDGMVFTAYRFGTDRWKPKTCITVFCSEKTVEIPDFVFYWAADEAEKLGVKTHLDW